MILSVRSGGTRCPPHCDRIHKTEDQDMSNCIGGAFEDNNLCWILIIALVVIFCCCSGNN